MAQMLVRLAEAERALLEAEAGRDAALRQAAASEERLAAALKAMTTARALLDELQRREEIATGLRMRAIEETRRAVAGEPDAEAAPTVRPHGESAARLDPQVTVEDVEWELPP